MSHSSSEQARRARGWIVFGISIGLLTMIAVLYNGIRFFLDQNDYNKGHQAYLQADCTVAIQRFDSVLNAWRLLDIGGFPSRSAQEKAECLPFQAAVEKQQAGDLGGAMIGYLSFIQDYNNSALRETARSRGAALFGQAGTSGLADAQSCGSIDSLQAEQFISQPDVNLPPFYLSCGQFYDRTGDSRGSADMYEKLLTEYPNNSLAEQAKVLLMANPEACKESESLKNSVIAAQNEFMPSLYFRCGQIYDSSENQRDSFEMYKKLLIEYPNAGVAPQAEALLLANPVACQEADPLKNSVIAERSEFMPSLYYTCGQAYESQGNWEQAAIMYEKLLVDYPGHALTADAEAGLARSIVEESRAASAGEIPPPERSGSTGNTMTAVRIQNDSPDRLRIVFSGPESLIAELEACSTCTTYPGFGPLFCREKGPVGYYPLPAGDYDVVVESISNTGTTPWTGRWSLVSGDEYYSCFIVTTTFGP
jgi:tetratricopeptide (TPR) repeat protein